MTSVSSDKLTAVSESVSKYLIYGLVDPRTLMVRYVGLSARGLKRPLHHGKDFALAGDRSYKARWIRALRAEGLDYAIAVLQESTKESLSDDERWWIAFGRACGWPLTNLTEGGCGRLGLSHTDETRARIAAGNRGKVFSEETRARMRAAQLGKTLSPETRAKLSAARRGNKNAVGNKIWVGRKHSEESKAKMSASLSGRRPSEETRKKMSAAQTGRKHSEQSRAAMHAAQLGNQKWLGKKHTPETRAKMAAARTAYWAAKRAAKMENDK